MARDRGESDDDGIPGIAEKLCDCVLLTTRCSKELGKAPDVDRVRAQFKANARHASQFGFNALPPEKFKREESCSIGEAGKKGVVIYALKAWKFRIYGTIITVNNKKVFLGVFGVEKKRDKADRDDFETTAARLREYKDYL